MNTLDFLKNKISTIQGQDIDRALSFIEARWIRGKEFLGSPTGILCGAMTWVSHHELVLGVCQAGGFGILASGSMAPKELALHIEHLISARCGPFGVNLIVFHPNFQDLIDVCGQYKVSHIFLGGGLPSNAMFKSLNSYNIKPVAFAPSAALAQRLIRSGAQALVIEGNEAGGHVGPVTTQVLAQEILPVLGKEVPVFVAGGIGNGRGILSYLLMGASGCQLGSRFVCTHESQAHDAFKEAFIRAQARDAVLSYGIDEGLPVIPVRALANKATKQFVSLQRSVLADIEKGTLSLEAGKMKVEHFWSGALYRAVVEGDVEHGSVMAGQSVGMIKSRESCEEVIQTLLKEMVEGVTDLQLGTPENFIKEKVAFL
ncbi:NAD(P)H-dependent flavin oxidoreductase [Holospora curviuscula]|uniref:Nitronate monooxygenase n=1 Tax=Holospora curviuscula TaxID=1082868 RepID=A0A2S5RA68_9PROT|nr:nitronate monooxygenase [Holospora curviuscula]PPE04193.1 Nitronate monooxygenase [Holospora curviuscula]